MKAINTKTKTSLSYEFIRGLVTGEGCFTFCSVPRRDGGKNLLPTFTISMSERDEGLIYAIKETLVLKNKIYKHMPKTTRLRFNKIPMVYLIVRDLGQLKNIIIPFFYKKLHGYKAIQFQNWLDRIGNDSLVPESYKFIYKIYKRGFYDRDPKFIE